MAYEKSKMKEVFVEKFEFTYVFEKKPVCVGYLRNMTVREEEGRVGMVEIVERRTMVESSKVLLDMGIKSYRLCGEILENIELEEKNACVETYG